MLNFWKNSLSRILQYRVGTIDRYIFGKFLRTFFFTVFLFSMIAVVIDFSDKSERFIEQKLPISVVIFEYYLNYLPYINGLLWPIFTLISVIFFTSRMANNSELISILNAGVSFTRLLVPYLLASGLIMGILLLGNHLLIPEASKVRLSVENTYIFRSNEKGKSSNIHLFLDPNSKIFIRFYSKQDSSARDIRIEYFRNGELISFLEGYRAKLIRNPNIWRIEDYTVHTFDGIHESIYNGRGSRLDTALNMTPADFIRYVNEVEMMTTPELMDFVAREKSKGRGRTEIYQTEIIRRTSDAFTILILTLIGVALSGRKVRGGIGLHLALGVSLGAMFIFLSRFSNTFAINEALPVQVAVWIPNVVFSLIAVYLIKNAQQ